MKKLFLGLLGVFALGLMTHVTRDLYAVVKEWALAADWPSVGRALLEAKTQHMILSVFGPFIFFGMMWHRFKITFAEGYLLFARCFIVAPAFAFFLVFGVHLLLGNVEAVASEIRDKPFIALTQFVIALWYIGKVLVETVRTGTGLPRREVTVDGSTGPLNRQ